MAANHFPGDALSPFERRRLEELRRRLESDDPLLAAALTQGRRSRTGSVSLAVVGVIMTVIVALGAVVMFGFASVIGCLCSALTMYGIFKLCSTADHAREERSR